MGKQAMTIEQIDARIEAYQECIDHLEMMWTDDATERQQGNELQKVLKTQQNKWIDKKINLEK